MKFPQPPHIFFAICPVSRLNVTLIAGSTLPKQSPQPSHLSLIISPQLIAILKPIGERLLAKSVSLYSKEDIMKKILSIIVISVVLVGLAFYVAATAANPQDQANPGSGHQRMQAKSGPGLLMRYVRWNMAAQTVSEITQVPVDTIRTKLKEERLPAVLAEYHVDRKTFSDAMHAKVQALMGSLVASNYLTDAQQQEILARMDQYAQRRTLMKSVIDKAVTDGTITPDQAQMLLKRPR